MKLFLTSSGWEENPKIGKEFLKLVDKRPAQIKVFMITTARKQNKDWKYVKSTINELTKIGIPSKNVSIFNFEKKARKEDLKGIDIVYVCGGNTFLYLDGLRKTGLDKQIKAFAKRGGIYFGVSAGSYLACPTIEAAGWKPADKNRVGLTDLTGLNFVPFLIVAHFQEKLRAFVEKEISKITRPVIVLNDKQAILVEDKKIKIIGEGKKNIFRVGKLNNI